MNLPEADNLVTQLVLGRVLKYLRKAAGFSQVDFIVVVNTSQATLSRIENGTAVPDVLLFWRMCAAFGDPGKDSQRVYNLVDEVLQEARKNAMLGHPESTRAGLWTDVHTRFGREGLRDFAAVGVTMAFRGSPE